MTDDTGQPDYRIRCRYCGVGFLEMKDFVFHACPKQAQPVRAKARKPRPQREVAKDLSKCA